MIRKKILILWLTVLKLMFPKGVKISMKHHLGQNLKFWFDAKTDNGFILGFYEKLLAQTLAENLSNGFTFYDLGAHWGYFSLIASNMVGPTGKVYSFEPLPTNYSRLEKNIRINDINNIEAFNNAVSSNVGTVAFSNQKDSFANNYIKASDDTIQVVTTSLDQFVYLEGHRPPDFIKIDVEGAELDVLKGAKKILSEVRPLLHLSTHEIHNPGVDQKCNDMLAKMYYKLSVISHNSNGEIIDYYCEPMPRKNKH